jgi:hypothetical protein
MPPQHRRSRNPFAGFRDVMDRDFAQVEQWVGPRLANPCREATLRVTRAPHPGMKIMVKALPDYASCKPAVASRVGELARVHRTRQQRACSDSPEITGWHDVEFRRHHCKKARMERRCSPAHRHDVARHPAPECPKCRTPMRKIREHHTSAATNSLPRSSVSDPSVVWWCDKCVLQRPAL